MKYLLSPLILTLSLPSFAGENVYNASIENVRVRTWMAYIKLDKCSKYSRIKLDTEYGKGMYSAALTAFAANKKVRVELIESDGCNVTESEINFIDVSR